MSIDVPIIIHNRKDRTKKHIVIPVLELDTVKSIQDRISSAASLPREQLSLLLSGHVLEEETVAKELLLGPTTSLVALVVEHRRPSESQSLVSPGDSKESQPSTPEIGSFHVWCKGCDGLRRGKLRVYCERCSSAAVIVRRDPQGWKDVLKSKRIPVDCEECEDLPSFASFKFKCVTCSEICAPLSHIRGNWTGDACMICAEDNARFILDLGCNHPICIDCFTTYVQTELHESHFRFRPPYGYTVTCPCSGCERCVKDPHHFCLLGREQYRAYQRIATEKLIALDDQGVFCPFPSCGASFFWETEDDEGKTLCPECLGLFCRHCKSRDCTCQDEDATAVTIEATTRKCPGCSTNTERDGGCAHMHCRECGFDWCFLCVKPWTENCQWDHWFS